MIFVGHLHVRHVENFCLNSYGAPLSEGNYQAHELVRDVGKPPHVAETHPRDFHEADPARVVVKRAGIVGKPDKSSPESLGPCSDADLEKRHGGRADLLSPQDLDKASPEKGKGKQNQGYIFPHHFTSSPSLTLRGALYLAGFNMSFSVLYGGSGSPGS